MRRLRLLLAAAGALALLAVAIPASADDTLATVTVTGGALVITVPASTVDLGSRANSVGGGPISGPLGPVQVNDPRGAFVDD